MMMDILVFAAVVWLGLTSFAMGWLIREEKARNARLVFYFRLSLILGPLGLALPYLTIDAVWEPRP
jgi:uncharacterized membrane protein YwzB